MRCNGLHCEGCGHGGGAAGAVIALLVIIALALRKAWPAIVLGGGDRRVDGGRGDRAPPSSSPAGC